MRLELEVTGGFTGPAGTQRIRVDLESLPRERAARLRSALERLPKSTWGGSFLAPHPKSSDFRYVLRHVEPGTQRSVTFHLGHGPAELSEIAQEMFDIHDEAESDSD